MASHNVAQRRLAALRGHLNAQQAESVSMAPCSSAVRTLPRFDSSVMASFLDDLPRMKNEVYEVRCNSQFSDHWSCDTQGLA